MMGKTTIKRFAVYEQESDETEPARTLGEPEQKKTGAFPIPPSPLRLMCTQPLYPFFILPVNHH
jgi:hypothetical protein